MLDFGDIFARWNIGHGKRSPLVGHCKKGVVKDVDICLHPRVGIAVHLEDPELPNLLRCV